MPSNIGGVFEMSFQSLTLPSRDAETTASEDANETART